MKKWGYLWNEREYSSLSFPERKISVEPGKTYRLEISSDAPKGSGKGLYCVTDKKGTELLEDPSENRSLQMCVSGVQ